MLLFSLYANYNTRPLPIFTLQICYDKSCSSVVVLYWAEIMAEARIR